MYYDNFIVERKRMLAQIVQENHYYAYGLNIKGLEYIAPPYENNYNLYNGKEMVVKNKLEWNDYGARYYDPQIGRWHVVDPLIENTNDAYGYVYDNPINLIDPTGMSPTSDFINIETGERTHIEDGKDQVIAVSGEMLNQLQNRFETDRSSYDNYLQTLESSCFNLKLTSKEFDFFSQTLYAESSGGLWETIGITNVLENRASNEGTTLMKQLKSKSPYGVYGVWKTSGGKLSSYKYSYMLEQGVDADKKRLNIHRAAALAIVTDIDITNGAMFWDGPDIRTNEHYKKWGITFTNPTHNLYNQTNTSGYAQLETTSGVGNTVFTKYKNQGSKWFISK